VFAGARHLQPRWSDIGHGRSCLLLACAASSLALRQYQPRHVQSLESGSQQEGEVVEMHHADKSFGWEGHDFKIGLY
jgi:hypothetical protein